MKPRHIAVTVLAAAALFYACKGVDFTARTDTVVTATANPENIPSTGGQATITASLVAMDTGIPVPDKTVVRFSTTLGQVTPEAETTNGLAFGILTSDGESGTATVTAFSGSVSDDATVTIGATASGLSLTATPASLPTGGGEVELVVTVFGTTGADGGVQRTAPVEGISVAFSTTQGELTSKGNPKVSNAQGVVTDTLTTNQTAEVSVTAAGVTETISIPVGATGVTSIVLSAVPVNLPSTGGSSNLVAVVLGTSGPVPGVAVAWNATNGSLGVGGVTITDADGKATNTLSTTRDAIVSANAAGVTDSITVTVGSTPNVNLSIAAERPSIPLLVPMVGAGIDRCDASDPNNTPILPVRIVAQMQDDQGLPLVGREVQFFVDFFFIDDCAIAFGEFCQGGGGAFVTATTNGDGIAEVSYTMTDADIVACNCLPQHVSLSGSCDDTGLAGSCPGASVAVCGDLCTQTPPENQFCQVAISAISGGTLSDNAISIEYGR